MRRPLIGITSYVEAARWGTWHTPAVLVPLAYVTAVEAAGGRAVLLPPSPDGTAETVERLDGLVLAGGADLAPALYGAQPEPWLEDTRPDRDAGEVAVLRAALRSRLPTLGICRGMQLLTVVTGGALVQHLPELVGHDRHRPGPAGRYGEHPVRLSPGTRLHRILGDEVTVRSYHHQGIGRVGEGVRVAGWADDGTVEAVELPGHPFTCGVLWHPEADADPRLFEALVEAAGATPG